MNVLTTVSTRRLTWNAALATFLTAASALGWPTDRFPGEVDVVSAKTGRTRTFRQVGKVEYDSGMGETCVRYETHGIALVVVLD